MIKAINPFVQMKGRHRSFLEIHLAKTKKSSVAFGTAFPHLIQYSTGELALRIKTDRGQRVDRPDPDLTIFIGGHHL